MNIPLSAPLRFRTVADLIENLGDIPAERIRVDPVPGTATEQDVLTAHNTDNRLCELVDGVLVEKTAGLDESRIAAALGTIRDIYVCNHNLGIVFGADGTMKIMPGLVRIPDVSFVSWSRLPERKLPKEPIPDLVPDLAVEVLSESDTPKEMLRKLHEYFVAGVRQAWLVDAEAREIRVYSAEKKHRRYRDGNTIRGGKLLPGFTLGLSELFNRVEGQP
jgi:Uma2 family endonuclease